MKKQVKFEKKTEISISERTKVLKWIIIGLGILIALGWIGWFACDCIFVSKGIKIEEGTITILWWDVEFIKDWTWDSSWYTICNRLATITLSMLGGYIVLLLAYGVICGLNVKKNVKFYIYQLVVTLASFIGITLCIIEAAGMMVNEKWVLDIVLLPPSFNVYHLDFLKWMSVAFGFSIFTNVLMICTFRPYERHTIIKDCNLLIIVLGFASVLLFIPFVISLGWNDPFVGGASTIKEWIVLAQHNITWKHIVCQCITTPMGVFAGMVMVLLVIRLITVMFVYNQKWGEKKSHIIIFSAITFLMFASFIAAHANKLDFEKLINDYNSLKLGCLLVVLAQTVSCLASGIYCSISHKNYNQKSL